MNDEKKKQLLLIGIGNEFCSDDSLGLLVAREVKKQNISFIDVKEGTADSVELIEAWQGYKIVILVDAVSSGAKPGTVFKIDVGKQKIPANLFRYSTHTFSILEVIELARTLNKLPQKLLIYGVEGKDFTTGRKNSPMITKAIEQVSMQILEDAKTLYSL